MSDIYKSEWPWLNVHEPYPSLSGFRPVLGSGGMVSSPHHAASAAGIEILKQGGNAVDAAIAVSATLMVVCPMQCGPGGDAFWLFNEPDGSVHCLNGAGPSPRAARSETLRAMGWSSIAPRSVFSVTVPGAVDSWIKAHDRYGSIPLEQLIEPAARLAENGFPASRHTVSSFALCENFLRDGQAGSLYTEGGRIPELYSTIRQPELARSLRDIAQTGGRCLYEGDLARAIISTCKKLDGWLELDDLASYNAMWVPPLKEKFRGLDVYTAPPPSQGFALLVALNAIQAITPGPLELFAPDTYHLLIEAAAFALQLRDGHNSGCFKGADAYELIESASSFSTQFSPDRLMPRKHILGGSRKGDTAHLAVVDGKGFGVSLIQSLFFDFGSCIPVHAGGFTLQNRGASFSLIPGHVAELQPARQPPHTLMPTIVRREQQLRFVMGCMGGDGQMQTQLQLLVDMIDAKLDPQQAASRSRWYLERGANPRLLVEEGALPNEQELRAKGHEIVELERFEEVMGHAQVIEVRDNGLLVGGCDPRSDGQVAVF